MRNWKSAGLLTLAVVMALLGRTYGDLTEDQKRALFLNSREDMVPVPSASATPKPRPKPAHHATARPTPEEESASTPTPEPEETPEKHIKHAAEPEETPEKHIKHAAEPEETPEKRIKHAAEPEETPEKRVIKSTPEPEPPPEHARETPTPRPTPTPIVQQQEPEKPAAPIVVEKSGMEDDQGLIPPPPKSGWSFFGGGPKYTYLTPSVRAAIDRAPVKRGRWKYIVVHNSGTRQGNAHAFDIYHRTVRHMPNGLAYQFVIGNGTSSGNGEIEIGNRWVRQINGGHVASDYLNNIALGICLVGDFNRDLPTKAQILALRELINYLKRRCGKVNGHDIIVYGHKQINPKPTDCPGDRFPLKWLNTEWPIPH